MKKDEREKKAIQIISKTVMPAPIPWKVDPCTVYDADDVLSFLHNTMSPKKKQAFEKHWPYCLACMRAMQSADYLGIAHKAVDKHFSDQQPAYALAASSKKKPAHKGDRIGRAIGLAVDTSARKGFLIQCEAAVSEEEVERGIFRFNAEQADYGKSPPFRFLENKLKELFLNDEFLAPYRLNRREIFVEVEPLEAEGYFREAKSLALPVILSILAAMSGKKLGSSMAITGRVRQDGFLKPPIADVELKLRAAKKGRIKKIIMPAANRKDCPQEFLNDKKLEIHFFSHLGQVLEHLGLVKPQEEQPDLCGIEIETSALEAVEQTKTPNLWKALLRAERAEKIIKKAGEKGISRTVISRMMEVAEGLTQMRAELRSLRSAFIIGDPEKIGKFFPPSEIFFNIPLNLEKTLGHLKVLSRIVDGGTLGFAFDKEGAVDSIRKLNVRIEGDFHLNYFLSESNLKFAIASFATDSVIFLLTPDGSRIHVFCNGQMIGKFMNGEWLDNDLDHLEQVLEMVSRRKKYDVETVKRIGRIAIKMSDQNQGALFVIFDQKLNLENKYEDCLRRLAVAIERKAMKDLKDEEVINFAKEDGATLVDSQGFLRSFMAILNPRFVRPLDFDIGIGARHVNAQCFSAEEKCLAIVVSEDGAVTIYCDGKKLYRL